MTSNSDVPETRAVAAKKPVRRNDTNAPGLAARRVACQVLWDVLHRRLPLDETLALLRRAGHPLPWERA